MVYYKCLSLNIQVIFTKIGLDVYFHYIERIKEITFSLSVCQEWGIGIPHS